MGLLIVKKPCPRCGIEIEFEPCSILPGIVPVCDDCAIVQEAEIKAKKRADQWLSIMRRMPPDYAKSKKSQVNPCFAEALEWAPNGTHHGGIGLVGECGEGKSCAIACVVKKLRMPFLWWSGTEARESAIKHSKDTDRVPWEHGLRVPVLVLDDISQAVFTESWSSRFFDLLEARISKSLPTFWTSQIDSDDLKKKIFNQNGKEIAQAEAIVRRLSQHSLVLKK